ncbi:MAG TPA: PA14 domain-containing protein, partial [Candidatus Deferrimicrobium sp.]
QGLRAQYFAGQAPNGPLVLTRTERQLDGTLVEDALLLASPWVARWEGVLIAPFWGDFEVVLDSPSSSSLKIDGKTVLDEGSGERHAIVRLPQGRHPIRVTAKGGERTPRLAWRRPSKAGEPPPDLQVISAIDLFQPSSVPIGGLLGEYYPGTEISGPIAFSRVDRFIDFYFHYVPLARPYTVVWSGFLESTVPGEYEIGLRLRGKAEISLDGQLLLSQPEPTDYAGARVRLSAGRHAFRVRFLDHLDGSRIHLFWTPPGGQRQIVPPEALLPYP